MSAAAEVRSPDDRLTTCLLGEWNTQDGKASRIAISALSPRDCHVRAINRPEVQGARGSLWIGALGPFIAIVTAIVQDGCWIEFEEQLPGPIIDHFVAAGELPLAEDAFS